MIPLFQYAHRAEAWSNVLEDRVDAIEHGASVIACVADGAGGSGGGAKAADAAIAAVRKTVASGADTNRAATWCTVLCELDQNLSTRGVGETTVVVVSMSVLGVAGASVGDSGAWLIGPDSYQDLTENQHRKPLVVTGVASPVPFEAMHECSSLLAATDGLLKYASDDALLGRARRPDLNQAVADLVEVVRLRSGDLQDDVGVVLCRPGPAVIAHRRSKRHRDAILASERCGCFYCLAVFRPAEIASWTDEDRGIGQTALCPKCGVDSVIGSAFGQEVTAELLRNMHVVWFGAGMER